MSPKEETLKRAKVRPGEIIEVIFTTTTGKEYTKPYKIVHETSGKVILARIYKAVFE